MLLRSHSDVSPDRRRPPPQIADERFLVFMNDLLSSGNIPGLFPAEDMDDIINNVRPMVKRAGLPDTRDNCWDMFINMVCTLLIYNASALLSPAAASIYSISLPPHPLR
jgi:hypothetical protein